MYVIIDLNKLIEVTTLFHLGIARSNTLQEDCTFLYFELTSFSIWIPLLTELLSPALLALQTCIKTQKKEVSRWMSHPKHRIAYTDEERKRAKVFCPRQAFPTLANVIYGCP